MPEPLANSSKGDSDSDDVIRIHADQDLAQDKAADTTFLDEITGCFETSDDVGESINKKVELLLKLTGENN